VPTVEITNAPSGGGDKGSLQILFQECADLLFRYSPTHPDRNAVIRITYGPKGPHLRPGGSAVAGYDIDLTAANSLFDQHIYQCAHELCHVLGQVDKSERSFQWLGESLCEVASVFCMKTLASRGAEGKGHIACLSLDRTPYWRILDEQANRYFADAAGKFSGHSLKEWFTANEPKMRNDPMLRDLTGVVANGLLPIFMDKPATWAVVEFLNTRSISDFLTDWKANTPPEQRWFVDHVRGMFL
jgi:hypothetical protein